MEARLKKGGDEASRLRVGKECLQDIAAVLGQEVADEYYASYTGVFKPIAVGADDQLKAFGFALKNRAESIQLSDLTNETPDLAKYIDGRLALYRMES